MFSNKQGNMLSRLKHRNQKKLKIAFQQPWLFLKITKIELIKQKEMYENWLQLASAMTIGVL